MTSTAVRKLSRIQSRVARRSLVAAAAVAAALLVWTIAVPVLGLTVTVPDSPGSSDRSELELGPVLITAALAALAGWALLALLERFTPRARALWTVIAVAVAVLTLPYLPGFTVTERGDRHHAPRPSRRTHPRPAPDRPAARPTAPRDRLLTGPLFRRSNGRQS